ncbi:hypothetical protein V865_006940 [Kwoniella europaea PYCC6329]|uniref:Cyclin-domain-containing protein n=1 Tax=Kwoniella europaea PYCC6329 TaxID=1423913 RepID=A0AAX4KQW3_9TREE
MNGSTEIEAGPSRSTSRPHSHVYLPSSSSGRRLSNSTPHHTTSPSTSQSRSSSHSHRRHSSSIPNGSTSTSTSTVPYSSTEPNEPPRKAKSHHLDIANYPTQQLLRLLAGLLQHIATSNDALRSDTDTDTDHQDQEHEDEEGGTETLKEENTHDQNHHSSSSRSKSRSRSHSRTSSTQPSYQSSSSPTTALFDTNPVPPPSTDQNPSTGAEEDQSEFPLFTASKSSLSHPSSLLAFHARHIPSISIEAYLLRILKYCPTTNEVFLGLLVYFDRMTRLGTPQGVGGSNVLYNHTNGKGEKKKNFAIDSYNVHRLVIAGVTVASKFFSDVFYTNSRYAKVGGLPPTELNSLELQFLLLNDFRLRISLEEMQKYGDRLLAYAMEQEEEQEEKDKLGVRMDRSIVDQDTNQQQDKDSSVGKVNGPPSSSESHETPDTNRDSSKKPSESSIPPREKEKDKDVRFSTNAIVDGNTSTSTQPQPQISAGPNTSTGSGIKDWVRGEEVMGRMASPMRD